MTLAFEGRGLNQMLFILLDDDTLKVQRKPNALTPKPVVERPWWLDYPRYRKNVSDVTMVNPQPSSYSPPGYGKGSET